MATAPTEGSLSADFQPGGKCLVYCVVVEPASGLVPLSEQAVDWRNRFVAEVLSQVLPVHGGRLLERTSAGLLMEFDGVGKAVSAAIDLQRLGSRVLGPPGRFDEGPAPRIGIHVCHAMAGAFDGGRQGAELACGLATLSGPGQIFVSEGVRDQLLPVVDADIEDLGECRLQHINRPVRAYRVGAPAAVPVQTVEARQRALQWCPGIAVLPFECAFGHDSADMLGEAVADEVIGLLARSRELQVISGLSTRTLKRRGLDVTEIGARLDVPYVLSGRYRLTGDRLSLHVELADSRSRHALWSERLDANVHDVFDPGSGSLAERIAAPACRAVLSKELELSATRPLPALESYTLLFGGITLMHRNAVHDFERGRQMLEHLSRRPGRTGAAHAWLAKWHVLRVVQGWSPDRTVEVALALDRVRRALDADPNDALALAIAGQVHSYLRRDLSTAARHYAESLRINPNESLAWLFSATLHAYRGEVEQADHAVAMAQRLSPLDPLRYYFDSLASTAVLAGEHWEQSIDLAHRSIRANRRHASTWRTLAYALTMVGRMDEATQAVEALLDIEPGYTVGTFRERFPGRDGPLAEPWALALRAAGLPL